MSYRQLKTSFTNWRDPPSLSSWMRRVGFSKLHWMMHQPNSLHSSVHLADTSQSVPQIATGHYICARNFPAHRGRDHCRRGACCMFLRWHPGVQWKRRSSRKTLKEHHGKTEQCRHQAEQREVSVSSAGDWLFGLCHRQRWRESRPKENRGNPRNAWSYSRCRVTPFSRYGQLPRSLPSESVLSSPASHS